MSYFTRRTLFATAIVFGGKVTGAHTTFKLSGFQPFQCVPLSLTIYTQDGVGIAG